MRWLLDAALLACRGVLSWSWTPVVVVVVVVGGLLTTLIWQHRAWKRGWLSQVIATRLAEATAKRKPKKSRRPVGWRGPFRGWRLWILERWDAILGYFTRSFWEDCKLHMCRRSLHS